MARPDYEDDIDQLIFMGTPHRGAPEAYLTWEGGSFGTDLKSLLIKKIFELEAWEAGYRGNDLLWTYIHERPIQSLRQLLPIYDYIVDNGQPAYRIYPVNYPSNNFLENLDRPEMRVKLEQVEISNFVGNNGNNTVSGLIVELDGSEHLWEHGKPVNYDGNQSGLLHSAGDGTVPAESNQGFAGIDIAVNADHRRMLTAGQAEVLGELTGKSYGILYDEKYDKTLLIRVMSPVDFQVTDPAGQKLGRNLDGNGDTNEIKDAFYSGHLNDKEFATIINPQAGDHVINLVGVGEGEYRLIVSYLEDGLEIDKEFRGYIHSGQEVNLPFEFGEDSKLSELDPFARIFRDLEALNLSGQLDDLRYSQLEKELRKLEGWYLSNLENEAKKQASESRLIGLHLEIIERSLEKYVKRDWASNEAGETLAEDIQIIHNVL
jgi:hypothetical protein